MENCQVMNDLFQHPVFILLMMNLVALSGIGLAHVLQGFGADDDISIE